MQVSLYLFWLECVEHVVQFSVRWHRYRADSLDVLNLSDSVAQNFFFRLSSEIKVFFDSTAL